VLKEVDQCSCYSCGHKNLTTRFYENEDIAREIDESETIGATLIDYKHRIDVCLLRPPATSSSATTPTIIAPVPAVAKTRLPRLELGKFKGDVTGWTTFWDTFKAEVTTLLR